MSVRYTLLTMWNTDGEPMALSESDSRARETLWRTVNDMLQLGSPTRVVLDRSGIYTFAWLRTGE